MSAVISGDRRFLSSVKEFFPAILAVLIVIGFFTMLVVFAFHVIPEGEQRVLDVMLGSLGAAFAAVVTYYFGSSSGSAAKTEIMAKGDSGKP